MRTTTVPTPLPIVLTPEERTRLERWARGRRTPARLVRRARIILHAVAGMSTGAIARALRTDRAYVARWRARFTAHRLAGIQREASRPGRPPVIDELLLQAIVTRTTTTRPARASHWTTRSLAREFHISPKTVHRIWQANGITPHWVRPFGLRPASEVLAHLTEVIGGYLTPVDSAVVVCGDATWPHPPAHPRQPERSRGRRGARPVLADLPARYANLAPPTGYVIGSSPTLSRHRDWLSFLERLAARVPRGRWVHVLADNAATHQHPEVQGWVMHHPQIQLHLVPPHRPAPRWLVRTLQRWVDDLPPSRCRTVRSLREAVAALRPRRQRGTPLAAWTDSRNVIQMLAGNPKWRLPPPGQPVEKAKLVPCMPDAVRGPGRKRSP